MQLVQINQLNSLLCTDRQSSTLSTSKATTNGELFYSYYQKGNKVSKEAGWYKTELHGNARIQSMGCVSLTDPAGASVTA